MVTGQNKGKREKGKGKREKGKGKREREKEFFPSPLSLVPF
jgi:hypothetical protein